MTKGVFNEKGGGNSVNQGLGKDFYRKGNSVKSSRPEMQPEVCAEIGSVPTTPDPNTSAKVSRYKWEPYRDTNCWCRYYFLPRGGQHTFAQVSRYFSKLEVYRETFHQKYRGQGSI